MKVGRDGNVEHWPERTATKRQLAEVARHNYLAREKYTREHGVEDYKGLTTKLIWVGHGSSESPKQANVLAVVCFVVILLFIFGMCFLVMEVGFG